MRRTERNRKATAVWGLAFYIVLQTGFSIGWYQGQQSTLQQAQSKLYQRLALDLPQLKLAEPRLNIAVDESLVQSYLHQLNQQLQRQQWPLRALSIQDVEVALPQQQGSPIRHQLLLSQGPIPVVLYAVPQSVWQSLSLLPLVFAGLLIWLLNPSAVRPHSLTPSEAEAAEGEQRPRLTLNLHRRTLSNNHSGHDIALPNKPFCFYLALLEYCQQNPEQALHHHKPVPDELVELANKYFQRLIELGHTIRKRPDFNANLDKMLSEIRAALDEVFIDAPELKADFYPPKARGEGSRSKLHSYALPELDASHYEVIGK